MIPKKIHYCWFGGNELPKKAKKCIASWQKYCPDYEIIEWNEDNFDLDQHPYLRWCHDHKKWAYLSDLARLLIIYEHGGVYFDTDVEVISCINKLTEKEEAFFAFETKEYVNTGLGFGAVAGHKIVATMIEEYNKLEVDAQSNYQVVGCPRLNTKALCLMGMQLTGEMQNLEGAIILPPDYMNPYDDPTGRLSITENTVSIHWYTKSALSKRKIIRGKITRPFHRLFGNNCFKWLK